MKILVIGSGAREHSIVWKLLQSSLVSKLFVAPGNARTGQIACNVDINIIDIDGLLRFAEKEKIDLTIVGSEESLALDIVDAFSNKGLKIFGPNGHDAQLETSKVFAKLIMKQEGIQTASFEVFVDYREASSYINTVKFPKVIKADGLAKGKGVYVCKTPTDGKRALKDIMIDKIHGDAGRAVIIEDCLFGEEVSAHALVSGDIILPFPMSKDYGNFNGRTTGGMGAIAPVLTGNKNILNEVSSRIIRPVIDHLAKIKGCSVEYNFVGCVYPGIMITSEGLSYVLEYNTRLGDPENPVYMRLLKSDLAELLLACVERRLSEVTIEWYEDLFAVCVVLVSNGYPGKYNTGFTITGIENAEKMPGVVVFHAGTKQNLLNTVTAGGRVLDVTATGKTLEEAVELVYRAVEHINFEGMKYRDDIGL